MVLLCFFQSTEGIAPKHGVKSVYYILLQNNLWIKS
jgi:hypothetical protein